MFILISEGYIVQETLNLSTDADSSTNKSYRGKSIFGAFFSP